MKQNLISTIGLILVLGGCAAGRVGNEHVPVQEHSHNPVDLTAPTPPPVMSSTAHPQCAAEEIARKASKPVIAYLSSADLNYREPKIIELYPSPGGLDRGQEEAYIIVSAKNAFTSQQLLVRIEFSFSRCVAGNVIGVYPLEAVR